MHINVDSVQLLRDSRGLEGGGGEPTLDALLVFTLARLHPLKSRPLSVAGTDRGLFALHLSQERNIPQRPNTGAAATPLTEWAYCGESCLSCFGAACSQMLMHIMKPIVQIMHLKRAEDMLSDETENNEEVIVWLALLEK